MKITRILFPVDFSERSTAAAPFVHSVALRHDAFVVLMNVIEPVPINTIQPMPVMDGQIDMIPVPVDYTEASAAIRRRLEKFAIAELPKLDRECVVDMGDPATLISTYACANGIDLIALPMHGYGPFRALLGSVAAGVLHDADIHKAGIPIWTSAHAPELSHRAHPQPRHILVAINPERNARSTLEAALAIAAESDATLEIVTAVSEGLIAPGSSDDKLEELLVEGTRQELAKLQFEIGSGAAILIEFGSPAHVLRKAAIAKRADLIVIGHDSRDGLLGRMRGEGDSIIRDCPCPVLVL